MQRKKRVIGFMAVLLLAAGVLMMGGSMAEAKDVSTATFYVA